MAGSWDQEWTAQMGTVMPFLRVLSPIAETVPEVTFGEQGGSSLLRNRVSSSWEAGVWRRSLGWRGRS